jgi:threonine/homoserine/homoserine lactone efflux protein
MHSPPEVFLVSIMIGLAVAAPIGPVGVICLRRTLAEGPWVGLVSGLGAATIDALYSAIAAFGLTFISDLLMGHRSMLEVAGGLALCYLGYITFFSKPVKDAACVRVKGLVSAYISALLLTALNPYTILFFMAAIAAMGLPCASRGFSCAFSIVAGVFAGSSSWWVALALSASSNPIRSRMTEKALKYINRLAGGIFFFAGLGALFSGLFS